jgi:hypothetical protein
VAITARLYRWRVVAQARCLALLLLLCACAGLPRPSQPTFYDLPSSDDIRVLYVHGIGCHEIDYSAPFQANLALELGFAGDAALTGTVDRLAVRWPSHVAQGDAAITSVAFEPADDPVHLVIGGMLRSPQSSPGAFRRWFETRMQAARRDGRGRYPQTFASPPPPHGSLCGGATHAGGEEVALRGDVPPTISRRIFRNTSGGTLTFVEVLWSPLAERQRRSRLGFDYLDRDSEERSSRAWLNDEFKTDLINGRISDVTIYLGEDGQAIRDLVGVGLCLLMLNPDLGEAPGGTDPCRDAYLRESEWGEARFIIASEGLGSRIVFDALVHPDLPAFASFASRTSLLRRRPTFAFLSNQLPLFDLAESLAARELQIPDLITLGQIAQNLRARLDTRGAATSRCLRGWETARTALEEWPPQIGIFDSRSEEIHTLQELYDGFSTRRILLDLTVGRTAHECERVASLIRARVAPPHYFRVRNRGQSDTTSVNEVSEIDFLPGVNADDYVSLVGQLDPMLTTELLGFAEGVGLQSEAFRASRLKGLFEYMVISDYAAEVDRANGDCTLARLGCDLDSVLAGLIADYEALRMRALVFSDPNDLLTYTIPPATMSHYPIVFENVRVRMTRPFLPLPGRWGIAADPSAAHRNYRYDRGVAREVAHAFSIAVQ